VGSVLDFGPLCTFSLLSDSDHPPIEHGVSRANYGPSGKEVNGLVMPSKRSKPIISYLMKFTTYRSHSFVLYSIMDICSGSRPLPLHIHHAFHRH